MKIEKAKSFIKENARPLELALYHYFYEGGSKQKIIEELAKYQNGDGGFGHGLEADNWNPNSNPIATNDALITLHRISAMDECKDMIDGMITYLLSHDSFDEKQKRWLFAIESNKDYPHAMWWDKDGDGIAAFNPTMSLAAFVYCYGGKLAYYGEIIRAGAAYLEKTANISGDSLKCFLLCYELLLENGIEDIVDLVKMKTTLSDRLGSVICKDTAKYGVEYVSVPSDFFAGMYQEFITGEMQNLIDTEKAVLARLQMEDGGFDISWKWGNGYTEFEQARNWWRPRVTLDKLLFWDAQDF